MAVEQFMDDQATMVPLTQIGDTETTVILRAFSRGPIPGLTLCTMRTRVKQFGPEYLIPSVCRWIRCCVKGPCSYGAPARYGIFQIINKSLKSASRGRYTPLSQHDSWTNDPSTKFIARSRVPVGLHDRYPTA